MFGKRKAARAARIEELLQAGYRYAASLSDRPSDAADLVHDAWLKLKPRHGFLPDRALLFRTIRHRHFDTWRHEQIIRKHCDEAGTAAQMLPDQRWASIDEPPDTALAEALSHLRDTEREALFLSAVEGYTALEIANLTDSTRGSVLSLLHRARKKLQASLAPIEPVPEEQQEQRAEKRPEERTEKRQEIEAGGHLASLHKVGEP